MQTAPYFQYVRRAPDGAVGELVRESWSMRAERCRTAVEAALPDAALELYFNLGPAGRQLGTRQHTTDRQPRGAWIVGPRERPLLVEKEIRDSNIVGVRLHAGTAMHVLGVPASEVRATLLDLDLFWGREVDDVRDQLASTTDAACRLAIVESAITRRVKQTRPRTDAALARALCETVGASLHESIATIAARTGLTHRRLIAVFDEGVGLKPKAFQRVHRLRRVLRLAGEVPRRSWTTIAHCTGYYDQAHMINDFRALTGVRPADYAATRTSVGEGFMPYRLADPA